MPTRDVAPIGHPVWIDLSTADPAVSQTFYDSMFGWTSNVNDEFGGYITFTYNDLPVAGGMGKQDPSQPDAWGVYLAVDDIDAAFARAGENGATLLHEPHDVGTLGRMAFVLDPGGAIIGMWEPGDHKGFGILAEPNTPAWFELHTAKYAQCVAFYQAVFGWHIEVAGDTDEFRYCTLEEGAAAAAGIMDGSAYLPEGASSWAVYFGVEDADAAAAKATELGATLQGTIDDTPYGRLATFTDPNGAWFKIIQAPSAQ